MSKPTVDFLIALTQAVTALLIVLNPVALVPIIASVTGGLEPPQQRKLIMQVVLIGSGLLLLFTLGGSLILKLFGVTLNDLRVAGGLLLLSIAFSFVFKGSMTNDMNKGDSPSAAPIASPILVGPGAITTAVVLAKSHGELITAIAVVMASLVTWIVFRGSSKVYAVIKETGADVLVRIMGILLAAIAVVYIRQGIVGLIHMSK
ncbi:MAG: MarC family protein [Armatimonadetes bacterium]|nr:MarC family protein [Armatimonadota bacterium]